jgi:site-specific DNA recombinase
VEAEADTRGLVSKRRTLADGRTCGGVPFSRGAIHHLLTNPVYIGVIQHKDQVYPGQHPPLISRAIWDAVQDALQANAKRPRRGRGSGDTPDTPHTSPLAGKLVDETGDRLTPSHARSGARRRRYYVSRRLIIGSQDRRDPAAWRLPAAELERAAATVVAHHIRRCLIKIAWSRRPARRPATTSKPRRATSLPDSIIPSQPVGFTWSERGASFRAGSS